MIAFDPPDPASITTRGQLQDAVEDWSIRQSPKPQESLKASPPPRKRNPLPESHEAPEEILPACQALQYWSSVGASHEGMFGLHFPNSVDRARAVVVRIATQPSVKAGSL